MGAYSARWGGERDPHPLSLTHTLALSTGALQPQHRGRERERVGGGARPRVEGDSVLVVVHVRVVHVVHQLQGREFFIDNLLVRIHHIIWMISVDQPCPRRPSAVKAFGGLGFKEPKVCAMLARQRSRTCDLRIRHAKAVFCPVVHVVHQLQRDRLLY